MRIIMMGTGPFAVPTFRALVEGPDEVVHLVTRPVPPSRRGKAPPANPMQGEAERLHIPITMPDSINSADSVRQLQRAEADLLVVCDYGQILSAEALRSTPLGGINLHGSLLPEYRGAAPINWALYHGERQTGVSVIHMTPGLDAGPILAVRRVDIAPSDDAVTLERRLAECGVEAVGESIELLRRWDRRSAIGAPQNDDAVTRARRLRKSDGQVQWDRSAQQIVHQVRAFKPWPGTFTFWHPPGRAPQRWILDQVTAVTAGPDRAGTECDPGTVVRAGGDELVVATGQGLLFLDRIQPAGKRAMSPEELLRGYGIEAGQVLGPERTVPT